MSTARYSVAAPAAPSPSGERRAILFTLLALLVVASWVLLWLWSASPYGRYLEHGGWSDLAAIADLCRVVPQGKIVVPAALHALAWVLMITAMMLPTTYPLLAIFRRITVARKDAAFLLGLVVTGCFAAWFAFGVIAHGADAGLQWAVAGQPWFVTHGWIVGATVLAAAGWFQFSALKYRCLDECRTPFAFVSARWHGRSPAWEAFRIGLDHGAFCVGCCWALMLTMFVVGTGSLGWMLVLAALMAAEKNLPWGHRLRTPVGLGLLGWAAGVVLASI